MASFRKFKCDILSNFETMCNNFSLFFCRDGRIKVNDEIINVCGKRLRGLSIEEAIKALKSPKKELDIVVAREQTNSQSKSNEDFFNEDRLRDEHLRIAQKIHAYQNNSSDFHETCSEVNLSSRPSSSSKNGERISRIREN